MSCTDEVFGKDKLTKVPASQVTTSARSSANCQDVVDTAARSGKARVTAAVRLETFNRL